MRNTLRLGESVAIGLSILLSLHFFRLYLRGFFVYLGQGYVLRMNLLTD